MKIIFIKVHPPYLVLPERDWLKREYRMRWMLRQTKQMGHEASIYLLSNCEDTYTYEEDIAPLVFFRVDKLKDSKDCHTSERMLKRLQEEKPDIIIFKGFEYRLTSFLIERLGFDTKIAYIAGGRVKDKYLSKVSWIFAETEEQLSLFKRSNERTNILPKTVDSDIFSPSDDKEWDVVNVGNFDERKNQISLLPFFDRKCVLVGNGKNFPKISVLAHTRPNVHMPGDVNTEEVARYIRGSKVMVHPSTFEGFPRALIEGMSCGIPVVAFKKTIDGIVEDGVHGFLVEDDRELFSKVELLLSDDELRKKMGDAGRKMVLEKYGREATIPYLSELYKRLEDA